MARIRTIKPEFFRHEGLQDLESANNGACVMLVFAGLWGHCDKAGRFEWKPRTLKLDILPFLDFDMGETLALLCEAGFIRQYEISNRKYGEILSFEKHQRISGKELQEPEKYPEPTECDQGSNGEATGKHMGSQEGKGRGREEEEEGKGMDLGAPTAVVALDHPSGDAPQRKTSGTPKRASQLPDDFEPDDTAVALAVELGVLLSAELPKFRDYHAARGKPMKDWQAALRTWLRNAKAFTRPTPKQSDADRRAAWLADITGRTADAIDAPARLLG